MKKLWIPFWVIVGAGLSGCEPGFGPQALQAWGQKSNAGPAPSESAATTTTPTTNSTTTTNSPTTPVSLPDRGDEFSRGGGKKKEGKFGGIPSKKGEFGQEQQRKRPFRPIHDELPFPDHDHDQFPFPGHGQDPDLPPPHPDRGDGVHDAQNESSSHLVGESCRSTEADGDQICLGLKYVSYTDEQGRNVESEIDAVRDVADTNAIWKSCGIQFQLDSYQSIEPEDFSLRYSTRNYQELDRIRGAFEDPNKLLVVATGLWDRSGSLGASYANAWTNLPGEDIYGVVLERSVSRYPQILAHELGHYLGLPHTDDPSSLMNPVINRNSTEISQEECQSARKAARTYWRDMFR